jgi:hypothetical protein
MYVDSSSDLGECLHHPGAPIFHEGYKFYTCCQRRTTDFNEFLRQEGCTTGSHKWIDDKVEILSVLLNEAFIPQLVVLGVFESILITLHWMGVAHA